jgi:arabinose-5-phosphate isomerase
LKDLFKSMAHKMQIDSKKSMSHDEKNTPLASALRTIETELSGLEQFKYHMETALAEPFEKAVNTIHQRAAGKVIISGMGKSGHVGNKLAATLASTGTPAFFVHPAEASHGDLGMITDQDTVIALSWSGETAELRNLVDYTRRFRVPLIAITSNAASTLAKASDTTLIMPKVKEACPHNLAPTTSTLIQLALGDALAIALLQSRGFSASDFKTYHPGGQLGANLKFVQDVMHKGHALPLATPDTPMGEAIILISAKGFGCLLVVDETMTLHGIVTDGDLRRHLGPDLLNKHVGEVMTTNPTTIEPDKLVAQALEIMEGKKITTLAVVQEYKLLGLLHMHDLLRLGVA